MAKYLDSNGLSHFMTLIKTALSGKADTSAVPGPYESTPEMDGTGNKGSSGLYARGNHVHPTDTSRQATLVSGTNIKTVGSQSLLGSGNLTMANIGAAAASHAHGNITSGGDITATPPTVASGDKIIINDESASKVTNGPAFGTDTTKYLRNDGTWDTPPGTANQNAFSNVKVGSTTIAADTTTDTLEVVAGSNVTLTPDATNDKLTIAATDTTYNDFIGATSSAGGAPGLVPAPASGEQYSVLLGGADFVTLPELLQLVTGDTAGFLYIENEDMALDRSGSLMTSAEHTKLAGIAAGAEVNQNAFSNVKVGSTTVAADGKTDTLELVAGDNVALTPDATNDKVTIASTDTKNTAGSTDSSSKLFIIGATSQAANPQTYSQDTAYVGTDGHLYSNSKQVVNLSDSQALTNKTYNGYTLGAACAKAVDTAITNGSTSTNLPTTKAVADFVAAQVAGLLNYAGTRSSATGAVVSGDYYIASAAFTIPVPSGGTGDPIAVEAGDMIIVNTSGTSMTTANVDVIQTNIDTLTTTEIDALWAAA